VRLLRILAIPEETVGTSCSDDVAARRACLANIVDAAIVSEDKIRIIGSNDDVRSTFGPKVQPTPVVRRFVQEWRAHPEQKMRTRMRLKLRCNSFVIPSRE
jgi:hypothetical protein